MTERGTSPLKVVWAGLLASSLAVAAVSYWLRPQMHQQDGLGVLTWMSVAWAVLSTITGFFIRSVASEEKAGPKKRSLQIAALGTFESGILLAAVVHLVSPLGFGLYVASVPLAGLLASFPAD